MRIGTVADKCVGVAENRLEIQGQVKSNCMQTDFSSCKHFTGGVLAC